MNNEEYAAQYWEWVDSEFDRWFDDWEERDTLLTDQEMGEGV